MLGRCQVVLTGGIGILMSEGLHPVSKSSFTQPWGAPHRSRLWESLQEGLKGGKNKTSNQRNRIPSSRRGQPSECWLGEGRAPLGWGTSKTGSGLRVEGRCQGRTCGWVGPSHTAKTSGPLHTGPFSVVQTQWQASACLSGPGR